MLVLASFLTMQVVTIGSVTARPGDKASGYLAVAAGVDSATRIPISVLRGRQPGPTLALIAGTHGSEVAPIIALQRVREGVDPNEMRGTLVLVHVANLPSFVHRTIYRNPWDQKNLNRVYPGQPNGTVTERIAHTITTQIIDKSDYLVDMHAGDGNESLRPYTYWIDHRIDPRVDSLSKLMALAWGNDHIIIDTGRPRDPAASVYTTNTALLRGKPAITTEIGYLGMPDEEMTARNVRSVLRLLRHLDMVPGPKEYVEHPLWIDRTEVLTSPESGTWHALVQRGETVQKGTPLGRLTDYFGKEIAVVRATMTGVVLYVVGTPAMSKGEPVGMVGHIVEQR
ncbi:MAG TPA: M14 family metallopeptidase [Gemmatimonadaceae bacterium]|nr:M14 family metallopeptidase [Gemmatimonadaceae bacterium]